MGYYRLYPTGETRQQIDYEITMLLRSIRRWWAKARLTLSTYRAYWGLAKMRVKMERVAAESPLDDNVRPYEGLANLWHEYSSYFQPNYAAFLRLYSGAEGRPIRSVLDLACGTGVGAARLASYFPEVLGVDLSSEMLRVARTKCAPWPGATFMEGDFRTLDLGRTFDVAVCAFNSLNYVQNLAELRQVFQSVARHLTPGGLFVFDTTTHRGMASTHGLCLTMHLTQGVLKHQMHYDALTRKQTAQTITDWGVETHRRIALDPKDIQEASHDSGLTVVDYFSSCWIPGRWRVGPSCFFVLRKG